MNLEKLTKLSEREALGYEIRHYHIRIEPAARLVYMFPQLDALMKLKAWMRPKSGA